MLRTWQPKRRVRREAFQRRRQRCRWPPSRFHAPPLSPTELLLTLCSPNNVQVLHAAKAAFEKDDAGDGSAAFAESLKVSMLKADGDTSSNSRTCKHTCTHAHAEPTDLHMLLICLFPSWDAREIPWSGNRRQDDVRVDGLNVLFAQEIKFANDKQKQDAFNAAFVSVCSTGVKKEIDLLLAQVQPPFNLYDSKKGLLKNILRAHVLTRDFPERVLQGVDLEAKIDGQEEGSEQFTGLMWASYGGFLEIVKELISKLAVTTCSVQRLHPHTLRRLHHLR